MSKSLLVVGVFLLLLAFPSVAAAQSEGSVDWTDLHAVLVALAQGPLAAMVIGVAWSWLAKNISAWEKLPSNAKFVLGLVFSGALPVLAALAAELVVLPLSANEAYGLAMHGVLAWIASQGAHVAMKGRDYGTAKK